MQFSRAVLLRLFLALLLACAQQGAIRHALAHDFERIHAPSKDATGPDEAFCAKCLAIAHLDHADGVAAVHAVLAVFSPVAFEPVLRASATLAFVGAYRSRAPPAFS